MEKRTGKRFRDASCSVLCFLAILGSALPAEAFTLGETYDKSNWEDIKDLGPPSLVRYVKKGDFVIKTSELDFEWKVTEPAFLEATKKNVGKYRMSEKGYTVDKETGKRPDYIFGFPYPQIDPKDPQAGAKIMENNAFLRYRQQAYGSTSTAIWIGRRGKERELIPAGDFLFYQGRPSGPIHNPKNFLEQQMIFVIEPYDLRGTTSMLWIYNDDRLDSTFAYVPMLRRIRRTSPSSRSDPFLGADGCPDDAYGWAGKNQTMDWRRIGEATVLGLFTSRKALPITEDEDGLIDRLYDPIQLGYQEKGWQGVPWAPVSCVWHPRQVWIVEAMPKDKFYNYGRMHYYVDKETYNIWSKEIYDKADTYWKTLFISYPYGVTEKGSDLIGHTDLYIVIDDKTDHATANFNFKYPGREHRVRLPVEMLGSDNFTSAGMLQKSK
jgi:hypothetical protein